MSDFIFSINTVLPLLIMMSVGFLARKLHLLDDKFISVGNNLVFRIFLPILLCYNIMTSDTSSSYSYKIFLFVALAVLSLFLILFIIIPLIEKDNSRRGVMIQGIGRSNYALFGIPLVTMLFPDQDVSIASLLVLVLVPTFNILSVIALEVYRPRDTKLDIKKQIIMMVRSIVLNPLIISCILGFILLKLNLAFPSVVLSTAKTMSQVATPLALFLLGSSFEFSKATHNKRPLIIGVVGKLVVSPLIYLSLAVAFGFRGPELAGVLVAFASPTAVNSFTMAQQMGGDSELAGQQVVLSSVFSIITVFIAVFVLRYFGFL